jgi:GT2 family glycosyltransferase
LKTLSRGTLGVSNSDLDVVVLNWRTPDMSAQCVAEAARTLPGAAFVVVDNGSGDGSPEKLRAAVPYAKVVETGANLGFGAGMNAGVRAGERPFVLVLNSDARPKGDAFVRMLDLCASEPDIGVVTPLVVDEENRPIAQLPPEAPAWRLVLSVIPIVWKWVTPPPFVPTAGPPQQLDWMPALCAALFRRKALDDIDGFDPNYFLGWEEWDIARRTQQAGYRIVLHRGAEVIHSGHGSTPRSLFGWRAMHGRRALCYHLRKYHGVPWYALGRVACSIASVRHHLPIRTS